LLLSSSAGAKAYGIYELSDFLNEGVPVPQHHYITKNSYLSTTVVTDRQTDGSEMSQGVPITVRSRADMRYEQISMTERKKLLV